MEWDSGFIFHVRHELEERLVAGTGQNTNGTAKCGSEFTDGGLEEEEVTQLFVKDDVAAGHGKETDNVACPACKPEARGLFSAVRVVAAGR